MAELVCFLATVDSPLVVVAKLVKLVAISLVSDITCDWLAD